MSSSKVIPGLTADSFQAGSRHTVPENPKLVEGRVEADGSFAFCWTATGSKVYQLRASGNLITADSKKQCFSLDCRCPSFANQQMGRVPSVCKHLYSALTSVIDPSAEGTSLKPKAEPAVVATKADPVIDLSLDGTDDEQEESDTKRSANDEKKNDPKNAARPVKRAMTTEKVLLSRKRQATVGVLETPIKLFCTVQDAQLRRQSNDRGHWCWTQCRTLKEMILGTTMDDGPIQWLVIANYLVDFDFLLKEVPELISIPRVVVFYGCEADTSTWQQRVAHPNTVEFVRLDPKAEKRTRSNPFKYKFHTGTHHTKMFLVGRVESVRVMVHTANLIHQDIHYKAQGAYFEDFPLKNVPNGCGCDSDFEDTLVRYVESYGYNTRKRWLGDRTESVMECLRRYDFSSANAVLIPSIPGYHNLSAEYRVGHLKLKQAIARYTNSGNDDSVRPIVCQFSSISYSVSEDYLRQLQASMDTRLARLDYNPNGRTALSLRLVYPTVREIHNSIEGVSGGGSVPGKEKTVNKRFLTPLLHKWTSSTASNPWANNNPAQNNPLTKPTNVPHIKTFYQVSKTGDSMDWFALTSHNLSTQAWGRISSNQYGTSHYVESWELGVFLSPALLGVEKLVHWSGNARPGAATVPMPYKVYIPDEYDRDDKPWSTDGPGALMMM